MEHEGGGGIHERHVFLYITVIIIPFISFLIRVISRYLKTLNSTQVTEKNNKNLEWEVMQGFNAGGK